jgi:hypothetical protein
MIYKIAEPNKPVEYIKSVNEHDGTLEFQSDPQGAYYRSDGIIGNSTFDYLKFHFTEAYPKLKYLQKVSSW